MSIIVGLVVLGLIFIFFEVIVVGAVLGVLGVASLVAASVYAFQNFGSGVGFGVVIASIILVIVMLIIELKWLPKTKIGKRMFLEKAVEFQSTHTLGEDELIGKIGEAETTLAPSGKITVEGKEYEGFSQDGLIKKGDGVKVVARDNFRIIVQKVEH